MLPSGSCLSNENDRYRGISQIVVPDDLSNAFVGKIIGNISCIDSMIDKQIVLCRHGH